jgi:hypothetical protein
MTAEELAQALLDAAANPDAASVDGLTVTSRPLPDLIALDEYITKKTATATRATRGLSVNKIIPPGMAD